MTILAVPHTGKQGKWPVLDMHSADELTPQM